MLAWPFDGLTSLSRGSRNTPSPFMPRNAGPQGRRAIVCQRCGGGCGLTHYISLITLFQSVWSQWRRSNGLTVSPEYDVGNRKWHHRSAGSVLYCKRRDFWTGKDICNKYQGFTNQKKYNCIFFFFFFARVYIWLGFTSKKSDFGRWPFISVTLFCWLQDF